MIQNSDWDSSSSDENTTPDQNFDSTEEISANTAPVTDNSNGNGSNNNGSPADQKALQKLQDELEEAKARLNELTQISQQALADLQNFKKRTEEEKTRFAAYANASLISELLPVLDNIDRALTHIPEDPVAKEWAQGIIGILKQLEQILQAKGLDSIKSDQQEFDPNIHEAVMTTEGPTDKIIQQLQKGYRLGEKILRRAKVSVGHGESEKNNTQN